MKRQWRLQGMSAVTKGIRLPTSRSRLQSMKCPQLIHLHLVLHSWNAQVVRTCRYRKHRLDSYGTGEAPGRNLTTTPITAALSPMTNSPTDGRHNQLARSIGIPWGARIGNKSLGQPVKMRRLSSVRASPFPNGRVMAREWPASRISRPGDLV